MIASFYLTKKGGLGRLFLLSKVKNDHKICFSKVKNRNFAKSLKNSQK